MHCETYVSDAVRLYGQGASDKGDLSLSLLKAIDGTVEWLAGMQKEADGAVAVGSDILKTLQECDSERPLDPDGKMRDLYLSGEGKLREVIDILKGKRESANRDLRLRGHHVESLVSEFDGAIQAISQLHDMCIALRWAVAEHDADLEQPIGAETSSAEELLKVLKA
jgi:hypothetical protein